MKPNISRLKIHILISKLKKQNLKESENRIGGFQNLVILSFCAYSVRRERILEIREFQGLRNGTKRLIYGHLGTKKALTKSAVF